MAITSAISDLFSSIYELFASFFGAIYAVIHGAFSAVYNFIAAILSLVQNVITEAIHLTGGVGKFVASKYSHDFLRSILLHLSLLVIYSNSPGISYMLMLINL